MNPLKLCAMVCLVIRPRLLLPPPCPACRGHGSREQETVLEWLFGIGPQSACPTCGGTGRVPARLRDDPLLLAAYGRAFPWN